MEDMNGLNGVIPPINDPRLPLRYQMASSIFTVLCLFVTGISFDSKQINKNFLHEHAEYLLAAIVFLVLGTMAGLFHLWVFYGQPVHNLENPHGHDQRMNTYLGYFSLYMLYMGLTVWLGMMFAYILSPKIMLSILAALAMAPFIIYLIARYIYRYIHENVVETNEDVILEATADDNVVETNEDVTLEGTAERMWLNEDVTVDVEVTDLSNIAER